MWKEMLQPPRVHQVPLPQLPQLLQILYL
uniref:Uncharacterized protein n=1 Tax=Arundo donax TaxID=35708 RepID=A0A0A9FIB1_ARUDO